ncbi:MAG TPA: 50S ribosomal protein L23 [Candidatus Pacearchaeota archaeon]|nr:50S ribosomal protein L23 [Candidatus Pacearchaeota archaeon]HQI74397.1 50S ribosomal protein L23 [Candidatus Pacearchaeota archaeon]
MALLDILKNKEEKETKKKKAVAKEVKEETKEKETGASKEKLSDISNGQSLVLIKKPYITEKATFLSESGKYVFIVPDNANKIEIKKAIQDIYKVKVEKLNKIKVKPKEIGFGKNKGFTKRFVKIVVTVKKGQKIDILK